MMVAASMFTPVRLGMLYMMIGLSVAAATALKCAMIPCWFGRL